MSKIESKAAAALIDAALSAMRKAWAPYSNYLVGAALLTKEGNIYTGCNIENSAFTPTVCAERTAIFKAVSEGEREFIAIAVVGGYKGKAEEYFPPCGVCRQVMSEFCDPNEFVIILGTEKHGEYKTYTLNALLPHSFGISKISASDNQK